MERINSNVDPFTILEDPAFTGRGVLSILIRRGYVCRFSGYHFHLLFLEWGFKKGNFSGAGRQSLSNGEILLDRVIILSNFCVLEYTFHPFFLESVVI